MSTIEELVKRALRKIKRTLFKPKQFVWFKSYPSWLRAKDDALGYDAQHILDKCKTALLKVRDGHTAYERDSVLFDEIQYSWGLLAGLQKAAIDHNDELCVIDFGGSLGSSYFQNKGFLGNLKTLKWCIVEQPHFVKCGQENFENDQLKFYYTIEDCLKENTPHVLLLSSVIQYLEHPYNWIEKFIAYNIPYIIIDRTSFIEANEDVACLQSVPAYIYQASYPCWFFEPEHLIAQFTKEYQVMGKFDSGYTAPMNLDGIKIYWEGLILKK